ncbi:MAG: ParB/RepB/Spo0J family partition protein [Gemmatimonadales bacterium]|jgi:ParB family transcriptional regulator, chromosome partitioning protein|nr:ParB/RepB/Spo0J family partition protein [Gemmatimonadales bacterium]
MDFDPNAVSIRFHGEVPLEELGFIPSEAPSANELTNLDDLVESIEKIGLLQPIIIRDSASGPQRYDIVEGHRRYLAIKQLGHETIPANHLDVGPDVDLELLRLLLGLRESKVRQDMENSDYIDACGYLYEKYGTLKEVSDQTGIPYHMVSKYVKIDRLSDPVKDAVRSKEFTMDAALRGTQAAETRAGGEGLADPAEVLQLARALSPLSGVLQKKVVAAMRDDPALSIEEAIEGFEDLPVQIQVHLIDGELSFVLSAAQHREFSKLDLSPAELREFSELVNVETGTPDAIENWIEERREARRASGDEEPEGG